MHEEQPVQDYIVIDPEDKGQLWLDGIAKVNGKVMQFIAVPTDSGYSVESQVSGVDAVGGIQLSVTPVKIECDPAVPLIIKRLNGRDITVDIPLSSTVQELISKLVALTAAPIKQYLLYRCKRLDPRKFSNIIFPLSHNADMN